MTGMLLGALLCPCNIYAGLKIGWSFNMSITAALLSYGWWQGLHRVKLASSWGILENNLNQTTASAAASIAGAGLVAPIPALTLITNQSLALWQLMLWVLSVSLLGVVVGLFLRPYLVAELSFPSGIATAETLQNIYEKGKEASRRIQALLTAGVVAASLKIFDSFSHGLAKFGIPGALHVSIPATTKASSTLSFSKLGFALDPSLLMLGFGAIIGPRAGVSLLLGAIVAWGILLPWVIAQGWVSIPQATPEVSLFATGLEWLLWPGVTLMVVASLMSFALQLPGLLKTKRKSLTLSSERNISHQKPFIALSLLACLFVVALQITFFDIGIFEALCAVVLTLVLAVVAARVAGETGITPIGAMGKITQMSFAVISPSNPTNNLMAANVTGGAASQCADMMHDLKAGYILKAKPEVQGVGQLLGVVAGSVVGSVVYTMLLPDPKKLLLTPQWPAPAVATWKAVAEVFMHGWQHLPPHSTTAMGVAAFVGLLLALAENRMSSAALNYIPSAASMGLAFVLPAWNSISMFLGAMLAALTFKYAKTWSTRFVLVIAAGLIAGESLVGIVDAMLGVLSFQ
ncbi:MAG: OPT/YSL family transporter [Myxococcales bacterium]|nr:MAG: OPT/YSL family transporter [Myxococcales bacterium]